MQSFALPTSFSLPTRKARINASRRLPILAASSGDKTPRTKLSDNGALSAKAADAVLKPKESEEKKPPVKLFTPKPTAAKQETDGKTFQNKQRFVVPLSMKPPFDDTWERRKRVMEKSAGFRSLQLEDGPIHSSGGREIRVVSEWTSIPEWEAYDCSKEARRSHLPPGIYQYVPKKGEGFPEDFTAFIDYEAAVNAKY